MIKITLTILIYFSSCCLIAQSESTRIKIDCENCEDDYCWGEKPDSAKKYWIQMIDAIDNENYEKARTSADWLLGNASCLNKALYIQSEKVYKQLLKKSRGDEQLQDRVLEILDTRIYYFGEEIEINRKRGFLIYPYMVNRGDNTLSAKEPYWTYMYEFYKELISSTKDNPHYVAVKYYFYSAAKVHKLKKLSDDELLRIYNESIGICNKELLKADENYKTRWEKTINSLETAILVEPAIDCDFVKKNWIPKIKENPDDIELVKKAIRFLIQGRCTNDPDFKMLAELFYKSEKE